ncbi:MAG: hypothetical protein ACI83B_003526 [Sediminicola sp.]|jgi:hypothetical protein
MQVNIYYKAKQRLILLFVAGVLWVMVRPTATLEWSNTIGLLLASLIILFNFYMITIIKNNYTNALLVILIHISWMLNLFHIYALLSLNFVLFVIFLTCYNYIINRNKEMNIDYDQIIVFLIKEQGFFTPIFVFVAFLLISLLMLFII